MLLSACLIVKNEAHCLARCLSSLQELVDEIVLLDTGSTDQTLQIAAQYGAKIHTQPWQQHFALARNQALEWVADGERWILSIDADEYLTPANAEALQAFLPAAQPAIYALRWQQAADRPWSQKAVLFPQQRGVRYLGRVHELPWDPSGQLPCLSLPEISLSHQPRCSPLDPVKIQAYRDLLALDLEHPEPLERFHALRHWAQSELILHQDALACASFAKAWALVPLLPPAARRWGSSVLEALLFIAVQNKDARAYQHWYQAYLAHDPHSPRFKQLPAVLK